MKGTTFLTLLIALIFSTSPDLYAAGSERLSYSGRLASTSGVPVTGSVDLTIQLYEAAASVCSQTFTTVALDNGVFNVELTFPANCVGGTKTFSQTLLDAHNAGNDVFIEVTDDTNSVTYPKQLLTSVPFAITSIAPSIPNNFITTQMLGTMNASAGQVLQFNGASWGAVNVSGSGTVTNVATGTGLTGGPITGTGTIAIANSGVDTLQIADDAVTTNKITNLNVTTAKIANTAVTSGKLADDAVTLSKLANGSAGGQVMKWDGSNWQLAADADSGGTINGVIAGAGLSGGGASGSVTLSIGNNDVLGSMINTDSNHFVPASDTLSIFLDPTGGLTSSAGGVAARVDGVTLTVNGSNELEVISASTTPDNLVAQGAGVGQVLKWSGTAWVPSDDLTGGAGGGATASDTDVILNADNDSNGTGDVILQTRNLDRFKVTSVGHIETGSGTQFTINRTAPTAVGDAVALGSFYLTVGEGMFEVIIHGGAGGVSYSKLYQVPVDYDGPLTTWQELIPLMSSGSYASNDLTLDIHKSNNNTYQFRLRRVSGANAHQATIQYRLIGGINSGTWSDNSAATSPGAPGEYFAGTTLTSVNGRIGIATANPVATLDVNGEIRVGSTTALACAAGTAGTLRYNSTSNKVEFCDGTSFAELGAGAGSGSVTAADIQDNTITTIKIADGAITLDKISTASGNSGLQAVQASTGERDWLTASATAGMMVFNTDTAEMEVYTGSAWVPIGADSVGLDDAYDGAGAGTGRSVTVDAGAVEYNGAQALNEVVNMNNSQNGGVLRLTNTGTGSTLYIEDEANDPSPIVFDAFGRLGIGTDTPEKSLHVNLGASSGEMAVEGNQAYIHLLRNSYTMDSAGLRMGVSSSNQHQIYTLSAFPLILGTNNTEQARITSAGNLGLGTITPNNKLDVVGTVSLTEELIVGTTADVCTSVNIGAIRLNGTDLEYCNGTGWQVIATGAGVGTASLDAAYDDGNVITVDNAPMTIRRTNYGEALRIESYSTNIQSQLSFYQDSATGSPTWNLGIPIGGSYDGAFGFYKDGTYKMVIDNNNVVQGIQGIGARYLQDFDFTLLNDTSGAGQGMFDIGYSSSFGGMKWTSGEGVILRVGDGMTNSGLFNPASGNAHYTVARFGGTVNQSGTATGSYTGLKINMNETNFLGSDARLLDVQRDYVTRFSVDREGHVAIGTQAKDNSAALEIESGYKGFLPPRMSTASKTAIVSPANGLTVFDTDENLLNVFDGNQWVRLQTSSTTPHMAKWRRSTVQAVNTGSRTRTIYNDVAIDTGSMTSGDGHIVIQRSGYYLMTSKALFANILDGTYCNLVIHVNGSGQAENNQMNSAGGNYCTPLVSNVAYLNAGDDITSSYYTNSGGGPINVQGGPIYNTLSVVELVGNTSGGGGGSVGPGTVTATEIATDAVGSDELADNAVDTNAVTDGAITIDKLSTASGSAGLTITNATTGARDGMTAVAGMMVYNTETNQLEVYNGTAWEAVGSGGGSGTTSGFKVHRNGVAQTGIVNTGENTLDWTTEEYDLNSEFNLTNERFTPTTAGYYFISCSAGQPGAGGNDYVSIRIKKNGATQLTNLFNNPNSQAELIAEASTIVYLNGSTDYVTCIAYTDRNTDLTGSTDETYFLGHKMGGSGGGGSISDASNIDIASSTNGLVLTNASNGERDSMTAAAGMVIFNTDTNQLEMYNGTAWGAIEGGSVGTASMPMFGEYEYDDSYSVGTASQVDQDGILIVTATAQNAGSRARFWVYSDTSATPTTLIGAGQVNRAASNDQTDIEQAAITIAVKKDQYWRVTENMKLGTVNYRARFIPIAGGTGSGTASVAAGDIETDAVTTNTIVDGAITIDKLSTASGSAGLTITNATTGARDGMTPAAGMTVFNTETNQLEVYNGTSWESVGSGATGTASLDAAYDNGRFISADSGPVVITGSTSSDTAFAIDVGSVGIGTSTTFGSPLALLGPATTPGAQTILLKRSTDEGGSAGNSTGAIEFGNSTNRIYRNGNSLHLETYDNFIFGNTQIAPLEKMRLTAGGYLGVGTSTPSTTLHVGGMLTLDTNLSTCTATATGAIRANAVYSTLEYCNGVAWTAFTTAGETDMDTAYDAGGGGLGRSVTVDAGAVEYNGAQASNEIVTMSNSQNGGVLRLTNTGTGSTLYIEDEANDPSPFMISSDGIVGIGTDNPNTTTKLHIFDERTNSSTNSAYIYGDYHSTTAGPHYNKARTSIAYKQVDSGVYDTGYLYGIWSNVWRGMDANDAGELASLFGSRINYGHSASGASTASTNLVIGEYLVPYAQTGSIASMYDLYIHTGVGASANSVGTHYGLYVGGAHKENFIQGNLDVLGDLVVGGVPVGGFNPSGHFVLGNNDFGNHMVVWSGTSVYDDAEQGMRLTGTSAHVEILTKMAIDPSAFYRLEVTLKKVDGTGTVFIGAKSLSETGAFLQTDATNWYNYFAAAAEPLAAGNTQKFVGYIGGYNEAADTDRNRFDPGAKYFNIAMFLNYTGSGSTIIKSIELKKVSGVYELADGSISVGSTTSVSSAVLAVESTTQGFLPPRMTEAQRDGIASASNGLIIYNSDDDELNIYNGTAWGAVSGAATASLAGAEIEAGTISVDKLSTASGSSGLTMVNATTGARDGMTAAAGMMIFNTETGQLEFYDGSNWKAIGEVSPTSTAYLAHETANGTHGGATVSQTWTARTVNTEVSDPDNIVNLSSNQFELGPGTYRINTYQIGYSDAGNPMQFYPRVRNVTDSTTDIVGAACRLHIASGESGNFICPATGTITITASKTFELQYWAENVAALGLGNAGSGDQGFNERWAQIEIQKYNNGETVAGSGTVTDAADLDLATSTEALSLPRFTTAGLSGLTPATGDLVYNTDENEIQTWNGSAWEAVGSGVGSGTSSATELIAFHVHRNNVDALNVGGGTHDIDWTTEDIDTGGYFDLTNDRFTPTVPGYYYITCATKADDAGTVDNYVLPRIQKNGGTVAATWYRNYGGSGDLAPQISKMIYLDGDDYVECDVDLSSNASADLDGSTNVTYFQGFKISNGGSAANITDTGTIDIASSTNGLTLTNASTGERDSMTAAEGMIIYNTDTNQLEMYNGTAWGAIEGGSSTGSSGGNLFYHEFAEDTGSAATVSSSISMTLNSEAIVTISAQGTATRNSSSGFLAVRSWVAIDGTVCSTDSDSLTGASVVTNYTHATCIKKLSAGTYEITIARYHQGATQDYSLKGSVAAMATSGSGSGTASVASDDIENDAVTTNALADGAVTLDKIDFSSTGAGLGLPSMTEAQRDIMASKSVGDIIYNITSGQLEVWNGSEWVASSSSASTSSSTGTFTATYHLNTSGNCDGSINATLNKTGEYYVVGNLVQVYIPNINGSEAASDCIVKISGLPYAPAQKTTMALGYSRDLECRFASTTYAEYTEGASIEAGSTEVQYLCSDQGSASLGFPYVGTVSNEYSAPLSATYFTDALSVASGGSGDGVSTVTQAQRDALSPDEGTLVYNSDTDSVEVWNGSAWVTYGTGSSSITPEYAKINYGTGGTGTTVGTIVPFANHAISNGMQWCNNGVAYTGTTSNGTITGLCDTAGQYGLILKAGKTYRIEGFIEFVGGGTGNNINLGYIFNANGSEYGEVAWITDPQTTGNMHISPLREIIAPTVNTLLDVRIKYQNNHSGTLNAGYNSHIMATEMVAMASGSGTGSGIDTVTLSERDTLSPSEGTTIYNSDSGKLEVFNGTTWVSATGGTASVAPMFKAKVSGSPGVGNGPFSNAAFNVEVYDTNNNYDPTTYRFTPTVAGYYRILCQIEVSDILTGGVWTTTVQLLKNGATSIANANYGDGDTSFSHGKSIEVETIEYFNGTGDYVQCRSQENSGDTFVIADGVFMGYPINGHGDSEGNTPVAFSISKGGSQTISNGSTSAVIWAGTEAFDTHDMFVPANSTNIIIPKNGLYLIQGTVAFDANTTGNRAAYIEVNNSVIHYISQMPTTNGGGILAMLPFSKLLSLNEGDIIEILAYQNSGGLLNVNGTYSNVQIHRINGNQGGSTGGNSLGNLSGTVPNAVYVDSSGNVGIGTTTPSVTLTVNGTIDADNLGAKSWTEVSAWVTAATTGTTTNWSSPVYATCPAGTSLVSWALTDSNAGLNGGYHYCDTYGERANNRAAVRILDDVNNVNYGCGVTAFCQKNP